MEYVKLISRYTDKFGDSSRKTYCYSCVFNLKEHINW